MKPANVYQYANPEIYAVNFSRIECYVHRAIIHSSRAIICSGCGDFNLHNRIIECMKILKYISYFFRKSTFVHMAFHTVTFFLVVFSVVKLSTRHVESVFDVSEGEIRSCNNPLATVMAILTEN